MTDLEFGARTGPLPVVGKDGTGRHRAPATSWQPVHYVAAITALVLLLALAALGIVT